VASLRDGVIVLGERDAASPRSECGVPIRGPVSSARGAAGDERSARQTERKCCLIQVLTGGAQYMRPAVHLVIPFLFLNVWSVTRRKVAALSK